MIHSSYNVKFFCGVDLFVEQSQPLGQIFTSFGQFILSVSAIIL